MLKAFHQLQFEKQVAADQTQMQRNGIKSMAYILNKNAEIELIRAIAIWKTLTRQANIVS